jgi:hypothetical protein
MTSSFHILSNSLFTNHPITWYLYLIASMNKPRWIINMLYCSVFYFILFMLQWVLGHCWGLKWLGCGMNHPPLSSAEVKENIELYPNSPFVPSWQVTGCFCFRATLNVWLTTERFFVSRHHEQLDMSPWWWKFKWWAIWCSFPKIWVCM